MYILGISCFYNDSAACLVRNGKIIAAVQEERFTRKKHDPRFPPNAIKSCLEEADITIFILYMGLIGWSRLGLGAASAAAQYVVTHPQTSHNPINLDFLLDPLSKSEFLSFNTGCQIEINEDILDDADP